VVSLTVIITTNRVLLMPSHPYGFANWSSSTIPHLNYWILLCCIITH